MYEYASLSGMHNDAGYRLLIRTLRRSLPETVSITVRLAALPRLRRGRLRTRRLLHFVPLSRPGVTARRTRWRLKERHHRRVVRCRGPLCHSLVDRRAERDRVQHGVGGWFRRMLCDGMCVRGVGRGMG